MGCFLVLGFIVYCCWCEDFSGIYMLCKEDNVYDCIVFNERSVLRGWEMYNIN